MKTVNFNPRFRKKLLLGYLILLGITPLVCLLLPSTFFDSGESICLSVRLLDMECYGCGMTRALQHLIHLDFSGAKQFNVLSFIVLPLLISVWVAEIRRMYRILKVRYV